MFIVYTLHHTTVGHKIYDLVKQFCHLNRYPKTKRGAKYEKDIENFMEKANQLFDIFCYDITQRREHEKQHQLRMSDDDYAFFNDQKGPRLAKTTSFVEKLTPSDVHFARKAHASIVSTSTSVSNDQPSLSLEFSGSGSQSEDDGDASSSSSSFFGSQVPDISFQNRTSYHNLAMACDRYGVSDRAASVIATAALKDHGIITNEDTTFVIDRSKLRRERAKYREEMRKNDDELYSNVDGIYVDGRKDSTQSVTQINGKYYRNSVLEEHYVIVGEPGEFYLSHVIPEDGKGISIAKALHDELEGTVLLDRLCVIGSDGTASMTGAHRGAIHCLEELIGRPLQWAICLLHCNELPLRHVFMEIDGATKGPDSFSGNIGKCLSGPVSDWDIVPFKAISSVNFPELPNAIVDDLSSDQYYSYRICWAVILGDVDADLALLEVGGLCHSRWLTLACRILRFYVSVSTPSPKLVIIVEFCIKVYFPSWFEIKHINSISDGAKNFYNMIRRVMTFPNSKVQMIALKTLQRNAFFANPENILLGMLGDEDEDTRRIAVNKIHALRGNTITSAVIFDSDNFDGGALEQSDSEEDEQSDTPASTATVRKFMIPKLNFGAKCYYKLVNMNVLELTEPPILRSLSNSDIDEVRRTPLRMNHPCHNQAVERHIKVVTEASASVCGFARRDGMIRQKLKSRKLMKRYDTKQQFSC